MTLSYRLALAIGWTPEQIIGTGDFVYLPCGDALRRFDYRRGDCIWPIAKMFRAFPSQMVDEDDEVIGWEVIFPGEQTGWIQPDMPAVKWHHVHASDPEAAVAEAVIRIAAQRARKKEQKQWTFLHLSEHS